MVYLSLSHLPTYNLIFSEEEEGISLDALHIL